MAAGRNHAARGAFLARPHNGADEDGAGNRKNLLRMVALKERLPELNIVPAHEIRAFSAMRKLSPASSDAHHDLYALPKILANGETGH